MKKIIIKQIKDLYTTNWITLKQATVVNKNGKQFKWDFIARKNEQKIITIICHSSISNRILVIKEFRVPINKYVIEFPAGLIEEGETIEQAAIRELKEETGYIGKIFRVSPFLTKSAYLTSELSAFVEMEANENEIGPTQLEKEEDIHPIWLKPEEFENQFLYHHNDEYIIDSLVWMALTAFKVNNSYS
ncbi:NUDIX domain-containing protein [Promethearchaeum syntrophicum]|uniref:NUDIX domain-containing protein n=1 Tax=Promethearchaeum syntrophicum TaxID=2594042 RepID=A0A5B9DA15_9ARCH|nr:NUDIX hydrolase [Candidatus Prometheoarchaeum syntrophicum]QEE16069.1 ADP-ribose pyrophosphatase [Candidatus Prometheoarchaeum syntrophicum]